MKGHDYELDVERFGYQHPSYAHSHTQWGEPLHLAHCNGYLLDRPIAQTGLSDLTGCYPLFTCSDWGGLDEDMAALEGRHVSASLVADPFGDFQPGQLARTFDLVRPWKQHLVTDLSRPACEVLAPQHRRNLARAARHVQVEVCDDPLGHLDDWCSLYASLCVRYGITGLRAFSRAAFAVQLGIPGLVMLRATAENEVVGIHLWCVHGDVAYGHLGATTERGYQLLASYALYGFAMEYFRTRTGWLNLGASPGESDSTGGLYRFKKGWATGSRTAYFCGRILDRQRYAALTAHSPHSEFFPAYRQHDVLDSASVDDA